MTNPEVVTQIMVSQSKFSGPYTGPELLGEMADSRTGVGNVQDDGGTLY